MRLDLNHPEDIQYHSDESSWISSVESRLPNSSLGLSNPSAGSDVLKVIENFLANPYVPLCGARIHVNLKRYPNETDIENLVSKIRQHHAMVSVVIQTNSSGGFHPETMYNLATRTNGLGFFDAGETGQVEDEMNFFNRCPFLAYSVNANVSQAGFMNLPSFYSSNNSFSSAMLTVQDSGVLSTLQSFSLNFTSPTDTQILNKRICASEPTSNYMDCNFSPIAKTHYTVTLDYMYTTSKHQTLQLRINTDNPIDFWIPYAN